LNSHRQFKPCAWLVGYVPDGRGQLPLSIARLCTRSVISVVYAAACCCTVQSITKTRQRFAVNVGTGRTSGPTRKTLLLLS